MGADLKLDGMEEVLKELYALGDKASRLENKALREGIKPIGKDMIDNSPVNSKRKSGKHAKEYLKVGGVKEINGVKTISAGIQKADRSKAYYLKFHEWGWTTVNGKKKPARPFMQPAFNKNKDNVLEIMKGVLKKGLGL